MMSHNMREMLSRERANDMLAAAAAARTASQARPSRGYSGRSARQRRFQDWLMSVSTRQPAEQPNGVSGERVVLHDGSAVLIRQVRSSDAALLADGFARLSPRSRQMRFLANKAQLSDAELRYLTDIDHHNHEALGALSSIDGRGVGVARYVRDSDDPQAAEMAITIVDEWQGRGLGTQLLARLIRRARQADIHRFTALASADNVAVARLLRNVSAGVVRRDSGTVNYEMSLTASGFAAMAAELQFG